MLYGTVLCLCFFLVSSYLPKVNSQAQASAGASSYIGPSSNAASAAEASSSTGTSTSSSNPTSQFFAQIRNENQLSVSSCSKSLQCSTPSKYRSYNGSCNNPSNPEWGAAGDCLIRLLPAAYDGSSGIRNSVSGDPLPMVREVSYKLFPTIDRPTRKASNFFSIFGQGVAHDISSSTPDILMGLTLDGTICCPPEKSNSDKCLPILVGDDDPFYSQFNVTCLEFTRSDTCDVCATEKQSIPNTVTGLLDNHLAYGLTEEKVDSLRLKDGTGRLKYVPQTSGCLLPPNEQHRKKFCTNDDKMCFDAGDERVNQHSFLMSVHTLLMREHNRIADKLRALNPQWDEERLFQEARKISSAEWQSVIYGSYLPILLGNQEMSSFNLNTGQFTQWDPTVRVGSIAESTTGGFRAHTMVSHETGLDEARNFTDLFFNYILLHDGQLDDLVVGAGNNPSQRHDNFMIEDFSEHLLNIPNEPYGGDMVAVDILRGRDHGVPTYVQAVAYCSGNEIQITEFSQLERTMSKRHISRLENVYKDVRDIDLYVGMLMEHHTVPGSVLTPTAACFAARQFYSLKFGDRFYFEHVGLINSFTEGQIKTLRGTQISKIVCENTQIKNVPKNAFLLPTLENPILPCSLIRDIDLSYWKEASTGGHGFFKNIF